jgi:predicted Zn-dependent protease
MHRFDQAIPILQLNVTEHPSSPNAYDSLAEAFMLAGKTDAAIRNYRKSLQLDSSNQNARTMLGKLTSQEESAR